MSDMSTESHVSTNIDITTSHTTDDDDFSNSCSSSSLTNYSLNQSDGTKMECELSNNKNIKKENKWCIWMTCLNIVILSVVVCLLIISGIIRWGIADKESPIINNDDEIVKSDKYQMIYHREYDQINEIVQMDIEFEGDFFSFEDEEGSGIIVKLNKEGEEYKMCADQCECSVECQYDNECGSGMECIEYKCMESTKNRKETISEERRIAQAVVITVPLLVCAYGFFSSIILAQNYAKNTLEATCKEKCPAPSKSVSTSKVKVDPTEDTIRIQCEGGCQVNRMVDYKGEMWYNIIFDFCNEASHQNVYTEQMSVQRASDIFTKELDVYCKSRKIDRKKISADACVSNEYSVICKRSV